ncbi:MULTISPECIES: hypothetical protein [unclassified Blastococcus]
MSNKAALQGMTEEQAEEMLDLMRHQVVVLTRIRNEVGFLSVLLVVLVVVGLVAGFAL